MDRDRVIWRRPSPQERRQQVTDDLRRISGFLHAVIAEANHLGLPVPADAAGMVASLRTWERQLRDASG